MTKYLPAWKDKDGNRMVFVARNRVYDDYQAAHEYQVGDFIFYVPFGLQPSGIVEVEMKDGRTDLPHVVADIPMLGTAAIIEGPAFDKASA